MNLQKRHRFLGFLMLISQVLLTGFAIFWLAGQYTKEKANLWSDLKTMYSNSYKVTLDSFLVKHYIEPALGDTTVNLFRYSRSVPAVIMSDSIEVRTLNVDSLSNIKSARGVVSIKMSSTGDSSSLNAEDSVGEFEHDMLLQTVRLIVEHSEDSTHMNINARHRLGRSIDTLLFITTFESELAEDNLNIYPEWIEKSDGPISDVSKGVIYIGGWIDDVPAVKFENYKMLLLGRILPQLLFIILLIILTGLAFLLAYRSLRKQTLLNEMRSGFISNISHELKTPVSTVKVALEALKNIDLRKDSHTASEYLEMSSKELKRLELLITKVLDNSLIEHDNSILAFEVENIAEIIELAISSIRPKTIEAGAVINFEKAEDINLACDSLYLQGVLINLLDNSLKYGNDKPEVNITLERENDNAIISVSDNGPGIPEKYLNRVFDKFFRIPTSDIHNVKGYGLGLSYASLIVEMHKGSISVKNDKKGCTFTIIIPINRLED